MHSIALRLASKTGVMSSRTSGLKPHQPEMCGFKPEVLLDITPVFEAKRKAMECMAAQQHLWDYYTDLAKRRGTQLKRNAGPNLGLPQSTLGEAYMRVFPHVTDRLS